MKLFSQFTLGTLAAISMATLLPQPTLAEETNRADDLIEPQILDSRDPFDTTSGEQESVNMFDIIHRANFGTTRSMQEFRMEKEQSINDAAADFRSRQLQMLRDREQGVSDDEAAPPEGVTPGSNR